MDGKSGTRTEVRGAEVSSLPAVRPVARVYPQVSVVPNLFSRAGVRGEDPGRGEGQLVRREVNDELF